MIDPRVDAYIERAAAFAQPILRRLREIVHEVCPDVRETMKWSFPHFEYKGVLCSFAAFKEHCAFTFWKGSLLSDPKKILNTSDAMGHLGKIRTMSDLPPAATLNQYLREAMKLNEAGIKPKKTPSAQKNIAVPADLRRALAARAKARAHWQVLSPSHRREYIEWITEAKMPATRTRRIAQTVTWLSQGKNRNWKYERKDA